MHQVHEKISDPYSIRFGPTIHACNDLPFRVPPILDFPKVSEQASEQAGKQASFSIIPLGQQLGRIISDWMEHERIIWNSPFS